MRQLMILSTFFFILIQPGIASSEKENVFSPIREDIEWLDVWLPHMNDSGKPRILLIGNSITRAYYPHVASILEDRAYVARLSTSKSLGDPALLLEIALVLSYDQFDIIQFNNGLHGWGYTEEEYQECFPDLILTIRANAPSAKLIWATISPIRTGDCMSELDPLTERVKERNKIALEAIKEQDFRINDLFGLVINHPEYYVGGDGIHLTPAGVEAMAIQTAEVLAKELEKE